MKRINNSRDISQLSLPKPDVRQPKYRMRVVQLRKHKDIKHKKKMLDLVISAET